MHAVDGAEFVELVEDRLDYVAGLLVRVQGHFARRQLDISAGHLEEQLTARGLVQLAAIQAIPHGT